jgi:ribonuclease VapC
MFIDTSAFIAIFMDEPESSHLADIIASSPRKFTSALVRLETCMVLSTRAGITPSRAQDFFNQFIMKADITIMPIDDTIGCLSVAAFEAYGKGRGSKAQLNLADCMSYACAKAHQIPVLCIGRDFTNTDIGIAL